MTGTRTRTRARVAATQWQRCVVVSLVVAICCLFFELGAWQMGGIKGDDLGRMVNGLSNCTIIPQHMYVHPPLLFRPCNRRFTHHTPCYGRKNGRERHCLGDDGCLRCLVPPPKRYVTPFSWPKSLDYVPYANLPPPPIAAATTANLRTLGVRLEGEVFSFLPGGDASVEELASVIPIADGTVRTALDIGCGVFGWGAYLLQRNVLAMTFSPRDWHAQLALERGVPALIGVLRTVKLPYPSRSFDMVHCSPPCLAHWTSNLSMYMMEVDRVLRPGGYCVLSGPPLSSSSRIEESSQVHCWEKLYEMGDIAVWRKKVNAASCADAKENNNFVAMCDSSEADHVWYGKMKNCITPLPEVGSPAEVAGGQVEKFPDRLFTVPPRIAGGSVSGITEESFHHDNKLWKKRVFAYKKINELFGTTRYRNMMDMNAGFGGFAAAIESEKAWVMNVVPTVSDKDTLGIIYERGLIGVYHDWCEAFSTYPRTYDFIHADNIFSLYRSRCKIEDILLEMDRILRPEGAVIVRDDAHILDNVARIAMGMRWNVKMVDGNGLIVVAVKRYWVGRGSNSTPS